MIIKQLNSPFPYLPYNCFENILMKEQNGRTLWLPQILHIHVFEHTIQIAMIPKTTSTCTNQQF